MGSGNSSCIVDPVATPTRRGSDTSPNAFVKTAREMGITVDVITESFRFDPDVVKQLRAIIARQSPDIIQTHMIKSHFLVKLAGLGKRLPWIAYHHGYTSTDRKMLVYNQLNRWSLPSADRVITVCGLFAKQLARAGVRPERISVCHNSVAPLRNIARDERQALKRKLGIADDERVILSVGRLSREKGHKDLLAAIAILRQLDSSLTFKLLLVGDGPEREGLQSMASELRISDVVVFVGQVSDVAPFYAIADVFALPSHSEGSPNALLEAMAAGVPSVSTAVGGVPEIATSGETALMVPAQDPHEFADALRTILSQSELAEQLRTNASARVREFSPDAHARRLIRIYQSVTEPRPIGSGSRNQPYLNDPVAIAPGSDTSA